MQGTSSSSLRLNARTAAEPRDEVEAARAEDELRASRLGRTVRARRRTARRSTGRLPHRPLPPERADPAGFGIASLPVAAEMADALQRAAPAIAAIGRVVGENAEPSDPAQKRRFAIYVRRNAASPPADRESLLLALLEAAPCQVHVGAVGFEPERDAGAGAVHRDDRQRLRRPRRACRCGPGRPRCGQRRNSASPRCRCACRPTAARRRAHCRRRRSRPWARSRRRCRRFRAARRRPSRSAASSGWPRCYVRVPSD